MLEWEYAFPLVGYLCGSVPFAYLITKYVAGIDIRTKGSGNVGATNTLRLLGPKMGFFVLFLDMAKAFVVLLIGQAMNHPREILLASAAATVVGHNWPVFLKFKGGKGVAVSAAMLFYFFPLPGLIALGIFLLTVAATRYISLGSILAALATPVLLLLMKYPSADVIYTGFLAAILVFLHRANIARLLKGTENKLSFRQQKML